MKKRSNTFLLFASSIAMIGLFAGCHSGSGDSFNGQSSWRNQPAPSPLSGSQIVELGRGTKNAANTDNSYQRDCRQQFRSEDPATLACSEVFSSDDARAVSECLGMFRNDDPSRVTCTGVHSIDDVRAVSECVGMFRSDDPARVACTGVGSGDEVRAVSECVGMFRSDDPERIACAGVKSDDDVRDVANRLNK